jgi:hypothetical protein
MILGVPVYGFPPGVTWVDQGPGEPGQGALAYRGEA